MSLHSAGVESSGEISPTDLKHLSIEQLMQTEVTSFSRRPQRIASVATSIEVLTDEQLLRGGVTTLPDALRLGTGLHVAQADGHTWAISARGFNATSANKMQVVMDGRSLYSPLFSGVFWDVQDYMLEDLDRIEIIRGPGATIWGANAFNGVINIISKDASQTQGTLITGGGGDEENGFGGLRYGGKLGENSYYRIYTKYENRDGLSYGNGADAHDEFMMGQTGFRTDTSLQGENHLTFQGDFYNGLLGADRAEDSRIGGGNFLGKWSHAFSDTSNLEIQSYIDRTYRRIPDLYEENRLTYDLDLQHSFLVGERNTLTYGMEYQMSADKIGNPQPSLISFEPNERHLQLFSGFLQDEIAIVPELFGVTIGTKIEHNDFSGIEVQPSIRAAYTPNTNQTVWAGVSRAVRRPTRFEADLSIPFIPLSKQAPDQFESEKVIAYELGYRLKPLDMVSFDATIFYNEYSDLRSQEVIGGVRYLRNELEGDGYGFEIAANYQPVEYWRLRASYRYLETRLHLSDSSTDPTGGFGEGDDPRNIVVLQSMFDLPYHLQFDQVLRYVDKLPDPYVPAYLVADLRLAWLPSEHIEIAVVGRNLLDNHHPEIGAASPLRKEVEQSIFGKVTLRF
jgi:iron complex outermembrane receptor protein